MGIETLSFPEQTKLAIMEALPTIQILQEHFPQRNFKGEQLILAAAAAQGRSPR